MMNVDPERHLTEEEKKKIWQVISAMMREDDRDPQEVIRDRYGGDEEHYLRDMARQHRILLK